MRDSLITAHLLAAVSMFAGCAEDSPDQETTDANVVTGFNDAAVDAAIAADTGSGPLTPIQEAGTIADTGTTGRQDAATTSDAGAEAGTGSHDASTSDASAGDAGAADGGARDGGAGDAGGATFTRVFAIFQSGCGSCHRGATASGGLDLGTKATAYTELTTPGTTEGNDCRGGGRKRVVAGQPDMSLLVKKLEGTQDCGEAMPEGSLGRPATPLSAAQIGEVRAWIMAGALND